MAQRQRDHARERFWRQHFEQQRASGQSVRSYCQTHDIREPSFYAWRRLLTQRDADAPAPAPAPAFVPVTVVDTPLPAGSPIDIRLPGGRHVRVRSGCDRQLLADVLALLCSPVHGEDRPC